MAVARIFSFLVVPGKGLKTQPPISGTELPLSGRLYDMLEAVYDRADDECDIEIIFQPDEDGQQENPVKDLLNGLVQEPRLDRARAFAERLQQVTTGRSGLGLLFVIVGKSDDGGATAVLARFPAEQGVMAEQHGTKLSVQFLEQVFLKNAHAYKSALFSGASVGAGFDEGRVVDRQISGPREVSNYWIWDFLKAELRVSGRYGTKRLAGAIRAAVNSTTSMDLKHELIAASRLMRNLDGKVRSAGDIISRLGLSESASEAIRRAFPREDLLNEAFRFSATVFNEENVFRSVEMDTGAILIGPDHRWDEVFKRASVAENGVVTYQATGQVVDERLRKSK